MAVFILEHLDTKKQKRLELDGDSILVGRRPDAGISLVDGGVSKSHCLIRRRDGGYRFEDLGSQNGTFLNDVHLQEGPLADGDVLQVGRIRITVVLEDRSTGAAVRPRRRWRPTATIWIGMLATGVTLGLGLGYLTSLMKGDAPAAMSIEKSAARLAARVEDIAPTLPAVTSVPAPVPAPAPWARDSAFENSAVERPDIAASMWDFPGLVDDPVGPCRDAAESARVLFRLYLDLLQRPPTRREFEAGIGLSHAARWRKIRSHASLAELSPDHHFGRFLDRDPTEQESAFLLDAPPEALAELGLWLTATREYRARTSGRDRSLRQLAASLIVDFHDTVPGPKDPRLAILEDAVLALPDLREIVRSLAASAPAPTPDAGPIDITESLVAGEVFRFSGRTLDRDSLAELTTAVKQSPDALAWLRQTLALNEDYWTY